jgi:putative component of toxin-antitoxin plasmid stabilization module
MKQMLGLGLSHPPECYTKDEDKHIVSIRLTRIELGNFGDNRALGDKLWELKFRAGAA